jgi:hypothetical protein
LPVRRPEQVADLVPAHLDRQLRHLVEQRARLGLGRREPGEVELSGRVEAVEQLAEGARRLLGGRLERRRAPAPAAQVREQGRAVPPAQGQDLERVRL